MATYLQKTSIPGEQVICIGKIHWLAYGRSLFLFAFFFCLLIVSMFVQEQETSLRIWLGSGLVLIIALISMIRTAIWVWTTELAVTNRRVLHKSGLISRTTREMNLNRVESVDVRQSVLGRILDYGTIDVRGTGAGIEPIHLIADPLKFRSAILLP